MSPLYIILRGSLKVIATDENGKQLEVHTLRYGDAFGYSDLLKVMVSNKLNIFIS